MKVYSILSILAISCISCVFLIFRQCFKWSFLLILRSFVCLLLLFFFLHIVIYTSPLRKENKSPIENNRKYSVEKNTNIVPLKDFYFGAKDVSGPSDQRYINNREIKRPMSCLVINTLN